VASPYLHRRRHLYLSLSTMTFMPPFLVVFVVGFGSTVIVQCLIFSGNEIVLLRSISKRHKPIENSLDLFTMLSIIFTLVKAVYANLSLERHIAVFQYVIFFNKKADILPIKSSKECKICVYVRCNPTSNCSISF
jgi:hypothetical protein